MRRITTAVAILATVGVVGTGTVAGAATLAGHGNGSANAGVSASRWSTGVHAGSQAGTGWGRGNGGMGAGMGGTGMGRGGVGGGRAGSGTHATDIPAAVPGATISSQVADELAYMVQEEKLARDVYGLAKGMYPDRIFVNINRSESQHMAELRLILSRYHVTDPTATAKAGVYADHDLQALYDTLAAQVAKSRDEAIKAGIAVEKADIADLRTALGMSAPSDVTTVLNNLLSGSNRHLAAFQRNV